MTGPGRIGVLGGTFDPFHLGHLAVARAAHVALALDQVRIVPARVPPHRREPGASTCHRFAMAALAIASEPGLVVDDIEATSDEPSYTAVTLRRLHALGFAPLQIFFIAGADAFAEIATWRDYPRVLNDAHFVVVSRPGHLASSLPTQLPTLAGRMRIVPPGQAGAEGLQGQPTIWLVDAATLDVSSTSIRQRAAGGLSLEGLVPPLVATHIERHRLYRRAETSTVGAAGPGGAAKELHEQKSV